MNPLQRQFAEKYGIYWRLGLLPWFVDSSMANFLSKPIPQPDTPQRLLYKTINPVNEQETSRVSGAIGRALE